MTFENLRYMYNMSPHAKYLFAELGGLITCGVTATLTNIPSFNSAGTLIGVAGIAHGAYAFYKITHSPAQTNKKSLEHVCSETKLPATETEKISGFMPGKLISDRTLVHDPIRGKKGEIKA